MDYGWEGRRIRRLQVLRFLVALALPVLLLGSAIAASEWANGQISAIEPAGTRAGGE